MAEVVKKTSPRAKGQDGFRKNRFTTDAKAVE